MKLEQRRRSRRAAPRTLAFGSVYSVVAMAALVTIGYVAFAGPARGLDKDSEKIAEASRAAPAGLVVDATFVDWPTEAGGEFRVLRAGTNGWYCLPDYPGDTNYAPECFDEEWFAFLKAYLEGRAPATERLGLSYMLNARWAVSNTDRTATAPTEDNQWHEGGSHLMLVVPDPAMLDWFPSEPTPEGGAYVMFAGTPYAHLMIPIPEAHADGE